MISLDITLWVQIVKILILTFILNAILIKPILRILREREEHFAGLEQDIQRFTESAEQLLENYNRRLAEARMEAGKKREELKLQAKQEEKSILEAATKEAEARKSELLSQVMKEIEGVRKALREQVEGFAAQIAQKLLGRSI
ncbi:ATPase [Thermosulfuriphilus ammonigenes]|uniref:ATP synthase subunit b n=1 Tax=Thermosulfuriphilus ammonigenes TaxID=1936021 RepID=A0A6G7PW85_9BACT|nr:ATPase [Thermosulfuriphilus ammonigenes]MBA2848036.1 F-type H+-transporting ATPase subunit b [Thermosulfuriphilus ammonigenes]QIJ71781.1 ATPase [Thermosulfuriphilus ammonigenes]